MPPCGRNGEQGQREDGGHGQIGPAIKVSRGGAEGCARERVGAQGADTRTPIYEDAYGPAPFRPKPEVA